LAEQAKVIPQVPPHGQDSPTAPETQSKKSPAAFIIAFVILFGVWILLSGQFDLFHICLGLASCLLVSFFSFDLLLPSPDIRRMPVHWYRFIKYIPWLLYQVFVANIHVMYLVFHPRMMSLIDPRIMEFDSRLKSDMARVTLANSITLTPGTITVHISIYGHITFHVIDIESGKTLPWIMEARIADVFDE
jgi:multicomponent Na+:H+ antiporter subunit E